MKELTLKEFFRSRLKSKAIMLYDSYVVDYWLDDKQQYHLILHNYPNLMLREQEWFIKYVAGDKIHLIVKESVVINYE